MSLDHTEPLISLPSSIPPKNGVERGAFFQLTTLAPPSHGAPCSHAASRGLRICITGAIASVPKPSEDALAIQRSFFELETQLRVTLGKTGNTESISAIEGTKTRHPEWHFFVSNGAKKQTHRLATLYIGLKSLLAIRAGKPLSKSTITSAAQLLREEDLSTEQITALLHGTAPEQTLGQSWPRDLCRTWREVMRHFSVDASPPPPTSKERIAGQLLDAALHATASRRGGARSHRQLSKTQLHKALAHISIGQDQGTLFGALGVLVCIGTFSVDLIADLRLKSRSLDASWLAQIDVEGGFLEVDYSFITHEAAAPIAGAIPASYICARPLPSKLTELLRTRAAMYPSAFTLKELFPDEAVPAHDSLIFPSNDQIQPTWARQRRVIGTFLREAGMDNLLASSVSGDFTHVPRSKLYYACVHPGEMANAFAQFYRLAGWSEPTPLPESALAFGCQVVPTMDSLIELDQQWQRKVQDSRPGKHCTVDNLLKFHNNFMCWTAMRLSLLLALRESTEITIFSDIDEVLDRWIPIHDKHVPGDHGATPVPLTGWVRQTIQSVRFHCKSLHSRLHVHDLKDSYLARWCASVVARKTVPLLCIASTTSHMRIVATSDFIHDDEIRALVPPDFGRKAMENLLRTNGLRASEIDAILRHALPGQTTNCATSDTTPMVRWKRANQAVNQIALSIFKYVGFGLAKE